MSLLAGIPNVPTKEGSLRRWLQGGQLDAWAEKSQQKVIEAADIVLADLETSARSLAGERSNLEKVKSAQLIPDEEVMDRENRLDSRIEKLTVTLERVVNIRHKLTAVSQALLIAAITKPAMQVGPEAEGNTMRDANPRRRANVTAVDIMGDEDLTVEGG